MGTGTGTGIGTGTGTGIGTGTGTGMGRKGPERANPTEGSSAARPKTPKMLKKAFILIQAHKTSKNSATIDATVGDVINADEEVEKVSFFDRCRLNI